MGILEKESRKSTRNRNIQRIILNTVVSAGILSAAVIAPNVIKIIGKPKCLRQKEIINRSRDRLVEIGLLAHSKNDGIEVTKKGEAKLRELERKNYTITRPRRWDNKWRVLIFDIGEHRKTTRDKVRNTLKALNFYRLQDSVWVYPYDCEDMITLLKADFKIGHDLLYMIVDQIENDKYLKKYFRLE